MTDKSTCCKCKKSCTLASEANSKNEASGTMMDRLIERINALKNPSVVGLDTIFEYLPSEIQQKCSSFSDVGEAIFEFNAGIIDRICTIAPAVKVQAACYEQYGIAGMLAFSNTLQYAKSKGLMVISDIKRNDIGSSAGCYSKAYLGGVQIQGKRHIAFDSDFITVNGYLGTDGIAPFVDDCKSQNKGFFALVKTSNPSSDEVQNQKLSSGETVYEMMGKLVEKWGEGTIGKYGFSCAGAVVGATKPEEAQILRGLLPSTFFLVPGYGAQGGAADDLTVCFDKNGNGAIVNSSRGIICAYKKDKYKGGSVSAAAYNATLEMQEDLYTALKKVGKAK